MSASLLKYSIAYDNHLTPVVTVVLITLHVSMYLPFTAQLGGWAVGGAGWRVLEQQRMLLSVVKKETQVLPMRQAPG